MRLEMRTRGEGILILEHGLFSLLLMLLQPLLSPPAFGKEQKYKSGDRKREPYFHWSFAKNIWRNIFMCCEFVFPIFSRAPAGRRQTGLPRRPRNLPSLPHPTRPLDAFYRRAGYRRGRAGTNLPLRSSALRAAGWPGTASCLFSHYKKREDGYAGGRGRESAHRKGYV